MSTGMKNVASRRPVAALGARGKKKNPFCNFNAYFVS
jgi:hypothetical protein